LNKDDEIILEGNPFGRQNYRICYMSQVPDEGAEKVVRFSSDDIVQGLHETYITVENSLLNISWNACFSGHDSNRISLFVQTPNPDYFCILWGGEAWLVNSSIPGKVYKVPIYPVKGYLICTDIPRLIIYDFSSIYVFDGERTSDIRIDEASGINRVECVDGQLFVSYEKHGREHETHINDSEFLRPLSV